jgi:DNA polymerase-3 subunit delta'
MLAGPPGTGKRAAAAWMVGQKLGLHTEHALPEYPFETPTHADLHWLGVPEDHKSILIEQVRALVGDLVLTSYSGRGKAAVIEPADVMTHNAANSLLKVLEEPPGDALLVLIVDRPGHLPPTIVSRCQRMDFHAPPESEGLDWLDRFRPGTTWAESLRTAGGAPLAALDAAERLDASAALGRDFARVGSGEASPVAVAASWSKYDPGFVLDWLAREVQAGLRLLATGTGRSPGGVLESVLRRMDSRNLFCYLDHINRLRGQAGGSYNVQLALEGLLIDWATGLRGGREDPQLPGTKFLWGGD